MKNAFKSLLAVAVLLSLTACGGNKSGNASEEGSADSQLDSITQARIDLLEQVKTEDLGELVFVDMKFHPVYEEPNKNSPVLEGYRGQVQVLGPVVLTYNDKTDDGWYEVGDPLNNAVGWIRGEDVKPASREPLPETPSGIYFSAGWWEHIFAGIHKESGLAVGFRRHRGNDDSISEIMLGKLVNNVYVFHYFVQVDIPGGKGNGDFDIYRDNLGNTTLRFSNDYLLKAASSVGLILPDLTKISSADLGYLFEDQIGCTDDWNFCNYFYLNSDVLNERFRKQI